MIGVPEVSNSQHRVLFVADGLSFRQRISTHVSEILSWNFQRQSAQGGRSLRRRARSEPRAQRTQSFGCGKLAQCNPKP